CMNTGAGKNMNWFWKNWFFDNGAPDLAISNVKKKRNKYEVTVTSKGSKAVPVDLQITLDDNTVIKEHQTVSAWEKGDTATTVSFKTSKEVTKIVLGSTYVVDTNKTDNTWNAK
ncbi:MAG: M1 family metallopeptidase, partial [Segetibacter sp.]